MQSSVETLLLYLCLITGFSCWSSTSFAFVASDMRVVVVSPFTYSEDGVPKNVREEMAIDVDLPKETVDYFTKINAFKSVALSKSEPGLESDVDLFVYGEVLYVHGGNGAARYFGGLGGEGRALMLIGIKVFDAQGQLLHEGRIAQEGTRATNVVTAWSNKKNITYAMKALPQKFLPVAIGGDLEAPEGVVRALESRNFLAMRAAAKAAHTHGLFNNRDVTDAMESIVLQVIKDNSGDGIFIDSVAWCLINIGESGDNKYVASLVRIIESDVPNKIKKNAKNALKSIEKANK